MAHESDEQLVERARRGDLDAFDELYRRYERRIYAYLRRQTQSREAAEDLMHEVFLVVLRDRSFDLRARGFAPWLFRVARNRAINAVKAKRRETRQRASLAANDDGADAARSGDPERQLSRRELRAAIDAALSKLPQPQRDALLLKQVGELTYREIAEIQGVAVGTVKSRIHQAIEALRRRLAALAGPALALATPHHGEE